MEVRAGGARSCCLLLLLQLLTLCLTGILAGNWSVRFPSGPVCAVTGSSVVLPCSYDYPRSSNGTKEGGARSATGEGGEEEQQYKVLSEMWCRENSRCITPRYVFHSAGILPDPSYHGRVNYLGQPGTSNCSLRISDVRPSDSGTYVFYLITSHPKQKMPEQEGIQLLVADSSRAVIASAGPSRHVVEGGALRLACCSPAAGPQTQYSWYKSTSITPRHTGQVWSFGGVTSDASGSYYCLMQSGDEAQNSTMMSIDVEYSPRNTTVSVSRGGELQDTLPVTLTCSSDANPPVHTYVWYQGAACHPSADKSFHAARQSLAAPSGSSRTLSVTNITAEKYGQHCCVAGNSHGWQTSGVTLGVTPSSSSGSRLVIIGVIVSVLLAIIAIVAFFMTRRRKSSRYRSYVLTETTAPGP